MHPRGRLSDAVVLETDRDLWLFLLSSPWMQLWSSSSVPIPPSRPFWNVPPGGTQKGFHLHTHLVIGITRDPETAMWLKRPIDNAKSVTCVHKLSLSHVSVIRSSVRRFRHGRAVLVTHVGNRKHLHLLGYSRLECRLWC